MSTFKNENVVAINMALTYLKILEEEPSGLNEMQERGVVGIIMDLETLKRHLLKPESQDK